MGRGRHCVRTTRPAGGRPGKYPERKTLVVRKRCYWRAMPLSVRRLVDIKFPFGAVVLRWRRNLTSRAFGLNLSRPGQLPHGRLPQAGCLQGGVRKAWVHRPVATGNENAPGMACAARIKPLLEPVRCPQADEPGESFPVGTVQVPGVIDQSAGIRG